MIPGSDCTPGKGSLPFTAKIRSCLAAASVLRSSGLLREEPQYTPPVLGSVQHSHDGHAIFQRKIKDQNLSNPLTCHLRIPAVCNRPNFSSTPKLGWALNVAKFSCGFLQQKPVGQFQATVFCQIVKVRDQVAFRGRHAYIPGPFSLASFAHEAEPRLLCGYP